MGPLQMDFTFKNIRKFKTVLIHINNHYTRDIQIFSRAKIYFSNEEGKFGDDRAVDYLYMPDAMVEDARNVSINLHEEHGKYVMIQLFFAAKWMLISEISFISGKVVIPLQVPYHLLIIFIFQNCMKRNHSAQYAPPAPYQLPAAPHS